MSLQRLTRAEMRRRRGVPGVVSLSSMYLAVKRWIITSMILGTMSRISLSYGLLVSRSGPTCTNLREG